MQFMQVWFWMSIFFCTCYANEIPLPTKFEYGSKLNEAFMWQSQGHSTLACCAFELGYEQAIKAGESPKKLVSIQQLFFWYRMYGNYLGLMAPASNDYDRIQGAYTGCRYSHTPTFDSSAHTARLEARRREYLLGVAELISGVLGVGLLPPMGKRIAGTIAIDGAKRIWNIYQEVKIERSIALSELKRITDTMERVAQE